MEDGTGEPVGHVWSVVTGKGRFSNELCVTIRGCIIAQDRWRVGSSRGSAGLCSGIALQVKPKPTRHLSLIADPSLAMPTSKPRFLTKNDP